jgi:Predicted helicase
MTTLHSILQQIRQHSQSEREKGDRFEILMKAFFKTDPTWFDRFEDVWIWKEWPDLSLYQFSQQDTGIDLVARERDGGWCAIQSKCFDPHYNVQKADIDSFFTLSGKKPFTARLIVSTTDKWSIHAEDALADQQIPTNRIGLTALAESRIDWGRVIPEQLNLLPLRSRKALLSHQQEAVSKVLTGFQSSDKGKLVMACGTGKTFTSLKIAEAIVPQGGAILFLSPSISLVSQSLTGMDTGKRKLLSGLLPSVPIPRSGQGRIPSKISVPMIWPIPPRPMPKNWPRLLVLRLRTEERLSFPLTSPSKFSMKPRSITAFRSLTLLFATKPTERPE